MNSTRSDLRAVPRLSADDAADVLTAVRALHHPYSDEPDQCAECDRTYPCPTIRALESGGR